MHNIQACKAVTMVLQTICTGQVFSKMTVAKCHDSDDVMKLGIELTR